MSPTGIPRSSLQASSRGVHRTVKGHYSENARFRPSMHALRRTRGRPVQWLKFPWHRRNLSTGRSFLVPIIPLRWLCYQVPPISRFPVAAHLRSKIKGAFGSILRTKKEPPAATGHRKRIPLTFPSLVLSMVGMAKSRFTICGTSGFWKRGSTSSQQKKK